VRICLAREDPQAGINACPCSVAIDQGQAYVLPLGRAVSVPYLEGSERNIRNYDPAPSVRHACLLQ
jgi:hypothetical protein